MTPTASFKEKFHQAYSFFKWELKSCSGTLAVFSILAAVFTTITLTLCIVISLYVQSQMAGAEVLSDTKPFDYGIMIFQFIASDLIYTLTAVFTIIYTIRVFSYLHDKRKADLYGALPVSRVTLFFSKSVTAFVFTLIPALFFLGIIAIISVCLGQPLMNETIDLYVNLVVGSLACISAYGLIAICCGTTINSIIMFLAVCIAYPLSALFIKGVAGGFFYGAYLEGFNNSFIMNALNPLSAYSGTNVIYWIIFTIACLAVSAFLIRKRKAERAQSSFAYYLPCHIVKILVAFLTGMFLGVLFGSLNTFGNGYAGFVFGFVLGSVPAFIISHLIFYKGFNKLIKTSIPLAGLIVVTVAVMALCNFDLFGYNTFVPNTDEVKSAGLIDFSYCYTDPDTNIKSLAKDASTDLEDKDKINTVITYHNAYLGDTEFTSSDKFINVWYQMFCSVVPFNSPQYAFSYELNNGTTVTRIYSSSYFNDFYSEDVFTSPTDITTTKEYVEKYSAMQTGKTEYITDFTINALSEWGYDDKVLLEDNSEISPEKAKADKEKVLNAFRKDFEADKDASVVLKPMEYLAASTYYDDALLGEAYSDYVEKYPDTVCVIGVSNNIENIDYDSAYSMMQQLMSGISSLDYTTEAYLIPKSYTNTVNALKEIGVLNDDLTVNVNSPYYLEYYY